MHVGQQKCRYIKKKLVKKNINFMAFIMLLNVYIIKLVVIVG